MNNDLIINETNFDQYFHDVKTCKPQPGEILASYEAVAELVDGDLKRDIINLLMTSEGNAVIRLIQKAAGSTEEDSIKVSKEIVEDLLNGLSPEDVAKKPYKFKFQKFFYTKKEYIPQNDKHWWSMSLIDVRYPQELESN